MNEPVRASCFMVLLSGISTSAPAEEFTNAVRLYLQQHVDAVSLATESWITALTNKSTATRCSRSRSNSLFPTGVTATIWREGDGLVGGIKGSSTVLAHSTFIRNLKTNFFLTLDGTQLGFIKNAKGEVTAIIRHKKGQPGCEGRMLPEPDGP